MRKRIANVAALLGALALAGALLVGAATLLDGARTAHAQESGGEQQQAGADETDAEQRPGYAERLAARIARYQSARAASAGVSGQASRGIVSGLAQSILKGESDDFTVSSGDLDADFNYRYSFFLTSTGNGIGFNSTCTFQIETVSVPRGNSSYSKNLRLYGCKVGTYTLRAQLIEVSIGENEEYALVTETHSVRVTGPTITISHGTSPITEGTNATFTLTASTAPSSNLTVNVRVTQSGSFISGTAPTSVRISSGRTTATLTVRTVDDSVVEADGSITAQVRSGTGYDVGSPSSASMTVNSDDDPTVTISRGTSPITEGTNATFTLTADAAPLSNTTVNVRVTQSGSFISGTAPTSVRILRGQRTATLTVRTVDDSVVENDGSITARVTSGTGYDVGTPSSTIVTVSSDDDPSVTISRGTSPINEGTNATFTLTASPAPLSNITVNVRVTQSGSFISGTPSNSVRIARGGTTATLTVRTSDDDTVENDGSITAQVRSGTGYVVGSPSSASVTVESEDDDEPDPTATPDPAPDLKPRFSTTISNKSWKRNKAISSFRLPAATGGDGTLRYSLNLALPSGVTRSNFTVRGTPSALKASTQYTWTATDRNGDTASLSFYITVVANKTPRFSATISNKSWTHNKAISSFRLPAATDGDGTLSYSLSPALPSGVTRSNFTVRGTPNALKASTQYTWTATDADGDTATRSFNIEVVPEVTIAAGTSPIAEGTTATFTLTASAAPPSAIEVNVWVTQSGTFISGTPPKSVTIPANRTTATLSVPTLKDKVNEADGYVRASVRAGTNYAVGSTLPVSVSVRDTPYVSIAAGPSITEGANATFTITAAGAPLSSMTVQVSVTESGTGGGTYIKGTAPSSVTIPASSAHQSTATLTVATEDDSTDEPNGSITASISANAAYELGSAFRASVNVQDNDLPKLAAPTGLTITPLPQRKARLDWGTVASSARYQVEVRKAGGSWAAAPSGSTTSASYEITLDSIVSNGDGLAQASAYQFRVKAIASGSTHADSDYSAIVEVRDTPITSINGDSSGRTDGKGQAVVTWSAVPGATAYTLRWRELPDHQVSPPRPGTGGLARFGRYVDHSDIDWLPQAAGATDWNSPAGASSSGMTVGGLNLGEIYAFQLTYTNASGQGFAARESYVWPSKGFPSDRVATYPFFGHWPNRTYAYIICTSTFPNSAKWTTVIERAFSAWNEPTMITMRRSNERCKADADVPISMISSLNNDVNEVFMVDTEDDNFRPFRGHIVNLVNDLGSLRGVLRNTLRIREFVREFDWFGNINEVLPICVFNAPACVISPAYQPFRLLTTDLEGKTSLSKDGSVDVLVRWDDSNKDFDLPDSVAFNTCLGSGADYGKYKLMVHEAAHAVGLSGFAFTSLTTKNAKFVMSHATIPLDTIMDYDIATEKACSPYPWDIMAVSALYQGITP